MIAPIGTNFNTPNYKPNFGHVMSNSERFELTIKDKLVEPMKKSGNGMKAAASFFIPGTGQLLQDRKEPALNHLVTKAGLTILSAVFSFNKWLSAPLIIGNIALNCYSALDAYYHKAQNL